MTRYQSTKGNCSKAMHREAIRSENLLISRMQSSIPALDLYIGGFPGGGAPVGFNVG